VCTVFPPDGRLSQLSRYCLPKKMLTALDALSTYYTENTLKARRNLRGDIDRRNGVLNRQFLDAMSLVNEVKRKKKKQTDAQKRLVGNDQA